MKHFVILFLIFQIHAAFAQIKTCNCGLLSTDNKRKHVLNINIFPIIGGSCQHAISNRSSWSIGANYFFFNGLNGNVLREKYSIFSVMSDYRYYFVSSGGKSSGYFIGPYLKYRNKYQTTTENGTLKSYAFNSIAAGSIVGYQKMKRRMSFTFYLGGGYFFYNVVTPQKSNMVPADYICNISLGYVF